MLIYFILLLGHALGEMEFFGKSLQFHIYIIYICRIVLSLIGIFLNSANIIVLCVSQRKISPMCRLVINLAVADISVCLCDIWSILIVVIFSGRYEATTFCTISFYTFLQIATFWATLFSVMFIALNNYLMVLKPLKYDTLVTRSFVNRSVIMLWTSVVVLSGIGVVLPGFIQTDSALKGLFNFRYKNASTSNSSFLDYNNKSANLQSPNLQYPPVDSIRPGGIPRTDLHIHTNLVASSMKKSDKQARAFTLRSLNSTNDWNHAVGFRNNDLIDYLNSTKLSFCDKMYFNFVFDPYFIFTIGTIVCVVLLLFMYCRICCEIRRYSRRSYTMTRHTVKQRRSTITTLSIVISFLVCWMPCSMNFLVIYLDDSMQWEYSVVYRNTMFIFQLINTIIDPILYAYRLLEVRKCYKQLLKRCKGIKSAKQMTLHTNL